MVDLVQTIIQRIALEGEREIRAQAERIKKSFDTVGKIDPKSVKSLSELQAGLSSTEKAAVRFGFAIREVGDNVATSIGRIVSASVKLGAVAATIGVATFALAKSAANAADEIHEGAQRTGQATGNFQKLSFAFEQSGGKAAGMERAMNALNDTIGDELAGRATEATKKFKELGIQLTENGQARDSLDIFTDIADRMSAIKNPADRAILAIQLFGRRAGPQLVELLGEGSKGIKALTADAVKLGLVLTPATIKLGVDMNDALDRMRKSAASTTTQLGLLFAPSITEAANRFAESSAATRGQLLQLGQTIADFLAPIIRDFVSLLVGEPEKIQSGFILTLYNGFILLGNVVRGLIIIFNGWLIILGQVAGIFNKIFGTKISGGDIAMFLIVTKLVGGFTILLSVGKAVALLFNVIAVATGLVAVPFSALGIAVVALGIALAALIGYLVVLKWPELATFAKNDLKVLGEAVKVFWELMKALWAGGLEGLIAKWKELWPKLSEQMTAWLEADWKKFTDSVAKNWETLINKMASQFEKTWLGRVVKAIQEGLAWLSKFSAAKASSSAGGGGDLAKDGGIDDIGNFAGGGKLRGPGSSTSDSIPIWGSLNEWMIRAKATRYYGDRFMSAINNMQIPRNILGMSQGGLVGPLVQPRLKFATGGKVSANAMRKVDVHFDGNTFEMQAREDVVDQMDRAATNRRVTSGGVKPSWRGRR